MSPQVRLRSRTIHTSQPAKASPTSGVGAMARAAIQISTNSNQREKAALKRSGTDRTPGEYAKDFARRNHPFAINAAKNKIRGGGDRSISGLSSCDASPAASPAANEFSI